jgi:hypothetical protein
VERELSQLAAGRLCNALRFGTNRAPRENFCKANPKLTFLNTFTEMLGPDGKPKPDIFVKDNLHMNPKGYAIWTPIVREFLK